MFTIVEFFLFAGLIIVHLRIVRFRIYTAAFGFLFVHMFVIDGFFRPTDVRASLSRPIELENERWRILTRGLLGLSRRHRSNGSRHEKDAEQ